MNDRIERISEMEQILVDSKRRLAKLEESLDAFVAGQKNIKKLEDYYHSNLWRGDFEADERGELPEDLKRGVLSEDEIFNLIEKNDELLQRLSFFER